MVSHSALTDRRPATRLTTGMLVVGGGAAGVAAAVTAARRGVPVTLLERYGFCRQIAGVATLSNDDVTSGRKCTTAIARSAWPIELHAGARPRLAWLVDDYYEIPYECFVPRQGESLLIAGRCLSAEHEAMASARVTAQCFSYGHAIGHAAALAVREKLAPREIDGSAVRSLLDRDGAELGSASGGEAASRTKYLSASA